ncbi:TPA_asm: FtsK [Stylophora coral adintovirus]|nr:TPA_asm: FtsK [Stylophora coral adintovirus]
MVNIPKLTTESSNGKRKRKAPGVDYLDEEYRMLICGPSGSGKTNTLMYMLREPLVVYDQIYIYSPNHHQELIQDFQKIMHKLSQKVRYPILHLMNPDEIPDTTEYPADIRKVVIFDDLITAPKETQSKILKHFIDGRHHNISPIYLSQSYHKTPVDIRLNCSHMIVYTPPTNRHRKLIADENCFDVDLFSKLRPFDFLFLDKIKETCMKNFDEKIQ